MEKRSSNRIFSGKFAATSVAILGLCLIGMLAVCGTISAQADRFKSDCSITVQLPPGTNESSMPDGLVYDLYEVAAGVADEGYDAYTFTAADGFTDAVSDYLTQLRGKTDSSLSTQIANAATSVVLNGSVAPISSSNKMGTKVSLPSGMYLAIVHGGKPAAKDKYIIASENGSYETVAYGRDERFIFTPMVISVPTSIGGNSNNTANSTGWQTDVAVTLKFEKEPFYGSIEIEKILKEIKNGEPATFVFQIDGYESANPAPGEKAVYSEVKSVVFNGAGTQSVIVDRIPAGLYVKVTEVYSGTSYKLVSQDPKGFVKIEADNAENASPKVKFTFENYYNDNGNGGGSVTNSFSYTSEDGSSDSTNDSSDHSARWVWSKDGKVQK